MRRRWLNCLVGVCATGALQGCVVPRDWRGDTTICTLHGTSLKSETRLIRYGTPGDRREYHRAGERLFPSANSDVNGGCINGMFSPVFAIIRYCPACREAEAQWLQEHAGM